MDSTSLVIANASVRTHATRAEVSALAIREGRVLAAGGLARCREAAGEGARVLDLGGRVVLPGFIDAHLHWAGYALTRINLSLASTQSLPEVLECVAERAARSSPGTWIVGRGWDHADWGRWPDAADLDSVAPAHPVALVRKDGHAMWVNSLALAQAGIDADTPSPDGGRIEHELERPSGILKENAIGLVRHVMPVPSDADLCRAMAAAWPDAWSRGITGIHDMGFGPRSIHGLLKTLRHDGELGLRTVFYAPQESLDDVIDAGYRSGDGDPWIRVGGLKLFLDGTLGSRTAHMLAPYNDLEGDASALGVRMIEPETLADLIERAAMAGLATAVHAIGDAANRTALDAFEAVGDRRPDGAPALRHRIEHAQLLSARDIPRFKALGVTASMQPIHATVDHEVARIAWGDRNVGAYAWRSLIDAGAHVAFGSDAPIETMDVFAGLHASLTRQHPSGKPEGGFHPQQRIGISEALRAYTQGAAWAGGQDADVGRLTPGRLADLIVLDSDPFETAAEALHSIRVLATMIDGTWVWGAPESAAFGIEVPD